MNIYIVGAPTSGKSTLAKFIKGKHPEYNYISFEAVRNGFIKTQPELAMDDRNSAARKNILPEYLVEFAVWNEKMTGCPTLIEGSFVRVERLKELARPEDIVVCLGYGEMSLDEIAKCAIQYAGPGHYLYGKSEEEFKRHFYDLADEDRVNREFCMANDVPYFVMTENRSEKLVEIVDILEKSNRLININMIL